MQHRCCPTSATTFRTVSTPLDDACDWWLVPVILHGETIGHRVFGSHERIEGTMGLTAARPPSISIGTTVIPRNLFRLYIALTS